MSYENVKNFRQRSKEKIIFVMGGSCAICGYNKCNSALELHHINPSEKEFSFSQNTNRKWSDILLELPKCILVCANCHREIHHFKIDNLKSSFNLDRVDELEDNKKQKTCCVCGKEISNKAKFCLECFRENKKNKNMPNREELKIMIRTETFVSIGKKYNITDNAIRKWCKKFKLPTSKKEINQYSDEEWLNI